MKHGEILAGAKFYARAAAFRAVHGVIPERNTEADNANWKRTRVDVRDGCIEMVRGILAACEVKT
jgi:hypothetical protein